MKVSLNKQATKTETFADMEYGELAECLALGYPGIVICVYLENGLKGFQILGQKYSWITLSTKQQQEFPIRKLVPGETITIFEE